MNDTPKKGRNLLLDALPRTERSALLAKGQRAHFKKGAQVFAMGSSGDTALFIETGRVRISVPSTEGRQTVLSHLGPGDVVGELAVLDGGHRSADADAATEVTGTLIGRAALLSLLQDYPQAGLALITALSNRLRYTNETFAAHVTSDGAARLALVLARLFESWSAPSPQGARLETAFSQSELGDMAGLTRESVNRILRKLEKDAVIARDGKHLILCDPSALDELAAESAR